MQKVHRISLSFLATAYKFILSPKKRKKKKKWFLDRERQRDRDSDRDRQRQRQRQGERESILCSSPHWEMCFDSLTVEELEWEGRRGVFLIYSLEIPTLLCKLETIAYTNLSQEITGHQSPTSTYFRTCQKAKPKKLQVNLLSLVRAPCQKPLFVSRMSFTLALRGTDSRLPDVGEVCLGVGCSHILPGGWGWLRPSLHIGSRQLLKPAFDQGAHQIPYENRREFPQLISPRIIAALVLCPAQCRHGMKGINQSSTLSSTSVKRPLAFFTEQVPWRWGIRLYKQTNSLSSLYLSTSNCYILSYIWAIAFCSAENQIWASQPASPNQWTLVSLQRVSTTIPCLDFKGLGLPPTTRSATQTLKTNHRSVPSCLGERLGVWYSPRSQKHSRPFLLIVVTLWFKKNKE